jgi:hypothetical protein
LNKLGIVITDGVGFRNFILTDFCIKAQESFAQIVIFSCLPKEAYKDLDVFCEIIELPVYEEKFPTWFFRKTKEVAHLKLHKNENEGITSNLKKNESKSKSIRGYSTRFIFKISSVLNSEKWIQRYNKWQQFSFRNNKVVKEYLNILRNENVDILFFTHQRPPFIAPLIYQAEKLKIITATFIFSWDNLASKGRMSGNFNYYLVWSNLMKAELLQFYSSITNNQIEIVGTPQFEPYVLERYQSVKGDFISKFNLDSSLKTICFSCGDVSTSQNDVFYIDIIANAIIDKKIPKVNFLVRTSPAEDDERFKTLFKKHPFIKWNFPKWELLRKNHQEVWSQRVPTFEDVIDLRSILEFSNLNINMLSTMSLDFMCFDKPVINPVFGNSKNGLYDDQRFLCYAHIKNVINSNATKIVKNTQELINSLNLYLEYPNTDSENRNQLVKMQIGKALEGTSERIVTILRKWSQEK